MKFRSTLLASLAAVTWSLSGCVSVHEQEAPSAYRTLLICRDISQPQRQTAQQRAEAHLAAVANHQKPQPRERYLAVQTLDPTPNQKANYRKFRAAAEQQAATEGKPPDPAWVEPSQLHCLMVFDTQAHQFVGSGCYVVGSLPEVGQIATFETFNAEYIGP